MACGLPSTAPLLSLLGAGSGRQAWGRERATGLGQGAGDSLGAGSGRQAWGRERATRLLQGRRASFQPVFPPPFLPPLPSRSACSPWVGRPASNEVTAEPQTCGTRRTSNPHPYPTLPYPLCPALSPATSNTGQAGMRGPLREGLEAASNVALPNPRSGEGAGGVRGERAPRTAHHTHPRPTPRLPTPLGTRPA